MSDTTSAPVAAYELVTIHTRDGMKIEQLMKKKDIDISVGDIKETGFLIMGNVALPYENFRCIYYEPSHDDSGLQPHRVYIDDLKWDR